MKSEYLIFTEIIGCGKIGKIALDSFHKYHNYPVHIYGTAEDFKFITPNENNIFIEVEKSLLEKFSQGHLGTATLWTNIIRSCPTKYMIHFDSDVIFRENIIDSMMEKSKDYDLIGPRRNYHNNPNGRADVTSLPDISQTDCFLFNKNHISKKYLKNKFGSVNELKLFFSIPFKYSIKRFVKVFLLNDWPEDIFTQMIIGFFNPLGFPIIDFFDPVMFDMLKNGAKIYHLPFDDVGGLDYNGSRNNKCFEFNNFPTPYKIDFGEKLVHFSCVGSGMNFYKNKESIKNVDGKYMICALDRYALFCKIFYGEDLPGFNLLPYSKIIDEIKKWYQ